MYSLASIIRSGLIWRALPPQKPLAEESATSATGILTTSFAIHEPAPSGFIPSQFIPSQFIRCTAPESKELYELCCEQIVAPVNNTLLRGVVPYGLWL